jgi:hypothetical protein
LGCSVFVNVLLVLLLQRRKSDLKRRVCHAASLLAALWLQVLLSAHAFSLAEVGGKVVIGRPLDVTVRVQLDPGEEVSGDCVSAEVLYGDTRQTHVRTSVLVSRPRAANVTLRVQADAFLDEPVATLVVRATCGTTTQRSYVLLADFPTTVGLPKTASANTGYSFAEPVLLLPVQEVVNSDAQETESRAKQIEPKVTQAEPLPMRVGVAKAMPYKLARASGKPVLKLDAPGAFSDCLDAKNSPKVYAPAEDVLLQSQKIASLENDIKTLRALAASNDAKVAQWRVQLQEAQANQMPNWLFYGIGLLLACCTVLSAIVWKQHRRARGEKQLNWWNKLTSSAKAGDVVNPLTYQKLNTQKVKAAQVGAVLASELDPSPLPATTTDAALDAPIRSDSVGFDLGLNHALSDELLHKSFEATTVHAPFEVNSIRHISVEPIIDIRQQAEFFVSLGQSERALNLLKKQIAESTEPNPLVYLDLILLYQTMGFKSDFRECRSVFHQLFNGVIPDFEAVNLQERDIEDYPQVVERLVELWPRTEALVFLSACIFNDMRVQPRQTFDLMAFRDLLMLHAMAEELVPDAALLDLDFSNTNT